MIAITRSVPVRHIVEVIVVNVLIANDIVRARARNAVIHKPNVVVINLHVRIISVILIQTPPSVKHHIVVDAGICAAEVDATNLTLIHRRIGEIGLIVEVQNLKVLDFDIVTAKCAYRRAVAVTLTGFIRGILNYAV